CPGHFGSFTVATHIDACSLCRVPIAMRDSLPQPIHAGDPSNLHRLSPRAAKPLNFSAYVPLRFLLLKVFAQTGAAVPIMARARAPIKSLLLMRETSRETRWI